MIGQGFTPGDMTDQFDSISSSGAGKLHIHNYHQELHWVNQYSNRCTLEFWELTAKDDIPVSIASTLITMVQVISATDSIGGAPYNNTPIGRPGWDISMSQGMHQYFKIRKAFTKVLMAGQSLKVRRSITKSYTFSRNKYAGLVFGTNAYLLYRGNRVWFVAVLGTPSVRSTDATQSETSYGGFEVSYLNKERYDISWTPAGNNQIGYQRAGNPSTGTNQNTVSFHPSIQSGGISTGAQGVN